MDEFYTVFTGLPQFYSALEGTFAKPFTRNLYLGRVDGQVIEHAIILCPLCP